MSNVLVVAEHVAKSLRKVTLSTINFAKQAAALTGGQVHVLVLGDGVDALASELAQGGYGADVVHVVNAGTFNNYIAENYTPAVAQVARELNASLVCAPSSTFGQLCTKLIFGNSEAAEIMKPSRPTTSSCSCDQVSFMRPMK